MKKIFALLLSLALVISMFSGCSKGDATKDDTKTPATTAPEEGTTTEPGEGTTTTEPEEGTTTDAGVKTGLGVISSIAKSTPAADNDGLGQVDSLAVAVLVGEDGKILDCVIDAAQTKVNFSKDGKITTDLTAEVKTKQELGSEYRMKKASKIQKEWNEQADAFAAYVVGKTMDEVKGIAITEEGVAGDADLASSVTIHIGDYVAAVAKAVANAQVLGANAGDKLGLGIVTEVAKSKDATAEEDGLAEAYSYYDVVTTDVSGKITSNFLDASIGDINFTTAGAITTDLSAQLQTKQELKEAYDMKKASKIGKEWYEQANGFSTYVTGKTLEEVKGIAITEDGRAGDADLASSVTVHIGSFLTVIEKAVANAGK